MVMPPCAARAAADARAVLAAGGRDLTSVDGDGAAFFAGATDAGIVHAACGLQHAHLRPGGLGIDGQAVAFGDLDALAGGQLAPVGEDEVHLAGDGDALADGYVALCNIPVRSTVVLAPGHERFCYQLGAGAGPHGAVLVKIRYAACRNRDGQQPQTQAQGQAQAPDPSFHARYLLFFDQVWLSYGGPIRHNSRFWAPKVFIFLSEIGVHRIIVLNFSRQKQCIIQNRRTFSMKTIRKGASKILRETHCAIAKHAGVSRQHIFHQLTPVFHL